jgi:hypothetical protein
MHQIVASQPPLSPPPLFEFGYPIDSPHVQTLPRFVDIAFPYFFCVVTPEKKVSSEDQRGSAFPFLVLAK